MTRIIINAVNIHNSGGLILLNQLISLLPNKDVIIFCNKKLNSKYKNKQGIKFIKIKSNFFSRFLSELTIYNKSKQNDKVLYFGNLPPIFKIRSNVYVFIQNRLLLDYKINLKEFPIYLRLKLYILRLFLKIFNNNASQYIVQTDSMSRLVKKELSKNVMKLPFFSDTYSNKPKDINYKNKSYDFIYVASGYSYKNHLNLLDAWKLLADENFYPSLLLTIDSKSFPKILKIINQKIHKSDLKVENIYFNNHDDVLNIYPKARALIFPSNYESFGIPLIEAKHFNLPVLAGELDYIRDLIDPIQTFDPNSSISIYRAVKRFLNLPFDRTPILTPKQFVREIFIKDN
tara:strand:- start:60 stop:1094 length:1035 start_codon:yes stop_codon:yes gene_type:complete